MKPFSYLKQCAAIFVATSLFLTMTACQKNPVSGTDSTQISSVPNGSGPDADNSQYTVSGNGSSDAETDSNHGSGSADNSASGVTGSNSGNSGAQPTESDTNASAGKQPDADGISNQQSSDAAQQNPSGGSADSGNASGTNSNAGNGNSSGNAAENPSSDGGNQSGSSSDTTTDNPSTEPGAAEAVRSRLINEKNLGQVEEAGGRFYYLNREALLESVKTDGTDPKIHSNQSVKRVQVYADTVYFLLTDGKLFSVSAANPTKTTDCGISAGDFAVVEYEKAVYFLYSDLNNGSHLSRKRVDGKGQILELSAGLCGTGIYLDGNRVYFMLLNEATGRYDIRYSLMDRSKLDEHLIPNVAATFCFYDGLFYYTRSSENSNIYSAKSNGEIDALIVAEAVTNFNISGDTIYYCYAAGNATFFAQKKIGEKSGTILATF